MINRLIEFSLKNRFLILIAYALLAGWGYWALLKTPIDAIPDLSENQVIVFTDWPGRSPQEVEDQISYPLTVNLQGLPSVKTVRSSSAFGFSMINIKLDKCGGLTEALAMVELARARGLGVMVGNMLGTSLAMAPAFIIGQFCDVVDLDGPILLQRDRPPGAIYRDGTIWCPDTVWGGGAS